MHYLNYNTNKRNLARTKQIKKYQDQIAFIRNNYQTWAQFKKLSGSTIVRYLKQALQSMFVKAQFIIELSKVD